ncbi:MAG: putative acetyltransferase [Arcticibacterium sp.]|jgi:putative acetyltransferase
MAGSAEALSIRKAEEKDLDEILDLFEASIRQTCNQDYNQAQIEVWVESRYNKERWLRFLSHHSFSVAVMEEQIAGFAALDGPDYLDLLYVHPNHQKTGVAALLFVEILKEAKGRGAKVLRSDVSITAKPFFLSKGFKEVQKNEHLKDGAELVNYLMVLEIKGS